MKYVVLIMALLLPVAAFAQAPQAQSASANFAAALATNLSNALADNDKLKAEVDSLQKQLDAKKPPEVKQ